MYGGNNTNKCKMWHKFNTCLEGVYKVYAEQKIREVFFSVIREKSKECRTLRPVCTKGKLGKNSWFHVLGRE